jgi:hypothetical protein
MLIALVLAYIFLGGGGAADFGHFYTAQAKDLIKAEVSDSAHRKGALQGAENAKKAIEAMGKQMENNAKRMKKLYEDYSSTPEQWDVAVQEGIDSEQLPFYDFVRSRQALLQSVTAQEWSAIIADAKQEDEVAAAKAAKKKADK